MAKPRIRLPKAVDPFYLTPAWRRIRLLALARDGYRCVICKRNVSGKGQARVDHIHALSTHPHLALTLGNLRVLCSSCDNQGHREKRRKGIGPREERFIIPGCDSSGTPADPNHPWSRE